jgi:hypothetical protein
MEKYLTSTESLLALIQSTLSPQELDRSAKAGEEMWEEIRSITDKYKLNVQQMLNATLACHATIIEVANEQINEARKGMKI